MLRSTKDPKPVHSHSDQTFKVLLKMWGSVKDIYISYLICHAWIQLFLHTMIVWKKIFAFEIIY